MNHLQIYSKSKKNWQYDWEELVGKVSKKSFLGYRNVLAINFVMFVVTTTNIVVFVKSQCCNSLLCNVHLYNSKHQSVCRVVVVDIVG
jgi:hypothetical protein